MEGAYTGGCRWKCGIDTYHGDDWLIACFEESRSETYGCWTEGGKRSSSMARVASRSTNECANVYFGDWQVGPGKTPKTGKKLICAGALQVIGERALTQHKDGCHLGRLRYDCHNSVCSWCLSPRKSGAVHSPFSGASPPAPAIAYPKQ